MLHGNYSIFILSAKTTPEVFFLSRDTSVRSIIEDQISGITHWPIEPKGSAEFVIRDLYTDGDARAFKVESASSIFGELAARKHDSAPADSCCRPH
jgi:hypothetical protein